MTLSLFPFVRQVLALLHLALAVTLTAQPAAARFQLDAAGREKIETEAQRLIDEQHTPGIAVAIMSEGQIVYAKGFGFGVSEIDGHTVYQTGGGGPGFRSNTKMFPDERIGFIMMTNSGAPQTRGQLEPSERPTEAKQPPLKKKGPGKKGPGKMGPGKKKLGGGRSLQDAPNPARVLKQVITEVITARL